MKLRPLPEPIRLERQAARVAFRRALAKRTIVVRVVCERCRRRSEGRKNGMGGVEAHHTDYSKPYEVTWLCHWCHMDADNEMRRAMKAIPWPGHECRPVQSVSA